jgi:hypothetical protein
MYELWLMLNIGWELLLMYLWPAVALAVAWVALMAAARGRPSRGALTAAVLVAAVVFVAALVGLPRLTGSSLGEARYAPDWLAILGPAAAVAAVAAAFAAPLRRLMSRAGLTDLRRGERAGRPAPR